MSKNMISAGKKNLRIRIPGLLLAAVMTFFWLGPFAGTDALAKAADGAPPASFAQLAQKASPSVVFISTVKVVEGRRMAPMPFGREDPFHDFFERFFGDQIPKRHKQQGLGSGFIIDERGFILTNNHVVEGADEIKVKLPAGGEFAAEVVGRDSKTDLALISIDSDKPLQALPLGDSEKLQVGDWVVAIGNPFGLENTVSAGIVSAKYRQLGRGQYENFIQTDASINRGNSGGPLLNIAGEVVGINTAIFSQSGGSIGIGFAIPINMAKDLLPQLKEGKVVRGWLGVMIQEISPELKEKLGLESEKGALVADVSPGGPADKAGIRRGDVIVRFGDEEINEMKELPYVVASTPVGSKTTVTVIRDGGSKELEVEIGELEAESEQAAAEKPSRPELGMRVQELTPQVAKHFGLEEEGGVIVVQIERGSPAAEAGLKRGDIILEIDQEPVQEPEKFYSRIQEYKAGDTVLFLVKRKSSTLYLTLKIWE